MEVAQEAGFASAAEDVGTLDGCEDCMDLEDLAVAYVAGTESQGA